MQSKLRWRIFMQFASTYLIVISLVFISIGTYAYYKIINDNRSLAQSRLRQQVERQARQVGDSIENIDLLVESLYYDKLMAEIAAFYDPVNRTLYPKYNEIVLDLYSSIVSNEFIEDIIVYFHRSDTFVSSNTAGLRPDSFFLSYLQQDMESSYEQFKDASRFRSPGEIHTIYKNGSDMLFITFEISFGVNKEATVLARIRSQDVLGGFADDIGSFYEIILEDGTVLAKGDRANTEDYYQSKSQIDIINAQYSVYVPHKELYLTETYLQRTLFAIYAVVIVAAVSLAYFFSYRSARPVAKMFDYSRSSSVGRDNALESISRIFANVVSSRDSLSNRIAVITDNLYDIHVFKLLRGDEIEENDLSRLPDTIQSLLAHRAYTAAVLRFHEQDLSFTSDEPSVILQRFKLLDHIHAYQVSPARIELFLSHDEMKTPEQVKDLCEVIMKEVYSTISSRPRLFTGNTVESYREIFISRCQANEMSYSMDWSDDQCVLMFDPKHLIRREPIYNWEDERYVLHNVINGKIESAKDAVRELLAKYHSHADMKTHSDAELASALALTLRRIINRMSSLPASASQRIDVNIWNMHRSANLAKAVDYFEEALDIIAEILANRRSTQNERLLERIDGFVRENYSDCEMTVGTIANAVMLSEGYVSAFYKQQTGELLSSCIEKYRMQEAARLTSKTDLSSRVIARRTGYFNMNTYYKAFKRFHGVSPKEYRIVSSKT